MHAMQSNAKQKKTQKLQRPKLCYHAKLHGKLPFEDDKLGLEPKASSAMAQACTRQAGESFPLADR